MLMHWGDIYSCLKIVGKVVLNEFHNEMEKLTKEKVEKAVM